MFSPQEQQIEICLLKSNLEDIENKLVSQRTAAPALDAQNEQKYHETLTALRIVRSLNTEIERLKMENVKLTAKRMQLKRQSEDITKTIENARENRTELTNLLEEEERQIELKIRQYEDSLMEKADRFRKTSGVYDEEEVTKQTNEILATIAELEEELTTQKDVVDEMKQQLETMHPDVPDNILDILGKTELDARVKEVTEKYEALVAKRNLQIKRKNDNTFDDILKEF